MNMISDLIERLKMVKKRCIDHRDAKVIDEAVDVIQELSEKLHANNMAHSTMYYNGGWIPWDGRHCPEERINPVIQDAYVYPVTVNMHGTIDVRYYAFCHGHWHSGPQVMDEYVTAWMYRPEPYREEEHETID